MAAAGTAEAANGIRVGIKISCTGFQPPDTQIYICHLGGIGMVRRLAKVYGYPVSTTNNHLGYIGYLVEPSAD